MAIQEAKQQHPDMLVTKAVVIRETESPTEELQHRTEVCNNSVHVSALKDDCISLSVASITKWAKELFSGIYFPVGMLI